MAIAKPVAEKRRIWSGQVGDRRRLRALGNGDVSVQKLVAQWAGKLVRWPER